MPQIPMNKHCSGFHPRARWFTNAALGLGLLAGVNACSIGQGTDLKRSQPIYAETQEPGCGMIIQFWMNRGNAVILCHEWNPVNMDLANAQAQIMLGQLTREV